MTELSTPPIDQTRPRPSGSRLRAVLSALVLSLAIFGDVLAFNQLATQSATDAILQTVVFSIGAAGFLEFLRRLLTPDPRTERRSALVPAALSLASLIIWRTQAPVGWSVLVTAGAALTLGLTSFRLLRSGPEERSEDLSPVLGLLCLAQTIVFLYIAALALADGRANLFG